MTVTQRRRFDDEDILDDFDPAYFPKRVYKDGRGPRVRLMLTDQMPPRRGAPFDARNHQPHQVRFLSNAEMRDAREASEAAYQARNAYLRDAWRTMPSATGGAAKTTAPPSDKPGESPRDAYIRRLSSWPPGDPNDDGNGGDADDIEALRQRWLSPGATPGLDAVTATKDAAAVADRDAAYAEYLDGLSNGWRR